MHLISVLQCLSNKLFDDTPWPANVLNITIIVLPDNIVYLNLSIQQVDIWGGDLSLHNTLIEKQPREMFWKKSGGLQLY